MLAIKVAIARSLPPLLRWPDEWKRKVRASLWCRRGGDVTQAEPLFGESTLRKFVLPNALGAVQSWPRARARLSTPSSCRLDQTVPRQVETTLNKLKKVEWRGPSAVILSRANQWRALYVCPEDGQCLHWHVGM